MLCDRDALPPGKAAEGVQAKAAEKLKVLGRYHLENYFLDEMVLAEVFKDWEPVGSWLRDPPKVRAELEKIATSMVPYATALTISARYREQFGNVDLMVKGCDGKSLAELAALFTARTAEETARFSAVVSATELAKDIATTYQQMQSSLTDGTWKSVIPGKGILERFASITRVPSARLKLRYLAECEKSSPHPFQEVLELFAHFSKG
jgi:hypothetical protein